MGRMIRKIAFLKILVVMRKNLNFMIFVNLSLPRGFHAIIFFSRCLSI